MVTEPICSIFHTFINDSKEKDRFGGLFFVVRLPPDTRYNQPPADPCGRRVAGITAALLAPGFVPLPVDAIQWYTTGYHPSAEGSTSWYIGYEDGKLYWRADRPEEDETKLIGEVGGGANVSGDQVSTYFLCRFYLLLT